MILSEIHCVTSQNNVFFSVGIVGVLAEIRNDSSRMEFRNEACSAQKIKWNK
jgi:hypothetical protein